MPSLLHRRIWMAIVVLVAAFGLPGSTHAQDDYTLVDQRTIEIEGLRPVGLSPDGRWLAAASFGMDELCVYDVQTLTVQSCASMEPLDARLRLEDVSWSPDSTRLVLAERSFVYFRDGDLWVMDAGTGELTNVADDGYRGNVSLLSPAPGENFTYDVTPAWSPDGESITYSRSTWIDGEMQGNDIVTIPAEGGEPESLVRVSDEAVGIVYFGTEWSPDGRYLYYSVSLYDSSDPQNGIHRYDSATGSTEQVLGADAELGSPGVLQINATGSHLLVVYPQAAFEFAGTRSYIWLLDLTTGELSELAVPGEGAPDHAFIGSATFSPDGQSLLLTTRLTTPDYQAWVTNIATGESVLLVEDLPGAITMDPLMPLSWAANGSILIPITIGSATLLTVEGGPAPEIAPPATDPTEFPATPVTSGDDDTSGTVRYVNDTDVPLRAAPAVMAEIVLRLDLGAQVTVIGPAEEGDGFTWLPIQDPETRTIGFIRAEFLSEQPLS